MKIHRGLAVLLFVILLTLQAPIAKAAVWYVDFASGNDANNGTTAATAFQHSPGDAQAKGTPAQTKLLPGDTVLFKGGVTYRGSITITASGAEGNPIIFDGNTSGKFGTGMAIISGGEPVEGLKPCASAAEAEGNPHFADILTVPLPGKVSWVEANLVQAGEKILHVAQDPNLPDPFFQENSDLYRNPHVMVDQLHSIQIEPVGMSENPQRALICMIDGGHDSGVLDKVAGGGLKITWPEKVTFTTFGIAPQPHYTWPKDFELYANGKLILKAATTPPTGETKAVEQRFPLPEPVTTQELEIKFLTAHPNPPDNPNFGAIASLSAYDASNQNVLRTTRTAALTDPGYFTQTDPHYWDGASLAMHVMPNIVIYSDVTGFDPAKHQLLINSFNNGQYKEGTLYSVINSLKVLDQPGEYVVKKTDQGSVLYVWPLPGVPPVIERSDRPVGLNITNASHLVIRGLQIQQFAGSKGDGINASGPSETDPATDLVIDGVTARFNRSEGTGAIAANAYKHVVVQNCELAENAGHMRGIILRNSSDVLVRKCHVFRGTGTGVDFYTCVDGAILDCDIDMNRGMHANGLTFYVQCKNILVEGNRVRRGNVGLTFEEGDGIIIRNNTIESDNGFDIGVWSSATPYNNIIIANNTLISPAGSPGIFGGNEKTENLYIVNNIMTPPGGNATLKGAFTRNLVLTDQAAMSPADLPGDNLFTADRKAVFKDAEKDFELAPGSPAAGAGLDFPLAGTLDIRGAPRAGGKDIGAYSLAPGKLQPDRPWEHVDLSSFKFPPVVEPASAHPKPNFAHVSDKPDIVVPALSFTGQGGGEVKRRDQGGYIAGWDTKDHWLEWTVDAPAAGDYELCIEEAADGPSQRSFQLNGQPVAELQNVDMVVSGGWKKFQEHYLKAPLKLQSGKNVIRVINSNGTPLNFHELSFYKIK